MDLANEVVHKSLRQVGNLGLVMMGRYGKILRENRFRNYLT